jgi:hypothetical protein
MSYPQAYDKHAIPAREVAGIHSAWEGLGLAVLGIGCPHPMGHGVFIKGLCKTQYSAHPSTYPRKK